MFVHLRFQVFARLKRLLVGFHCHMIYTQHDNKKPRKIAELKISRALPWGPPFGYVTAMTRLNISTNKREMGTLSRVENVT